IYDDLEERLRYQQDGIHFPIDLDYMMSSKSFIQAPLDEEYNINGDTVIFKKVNHPGGAYAVKIISGDKTCIYGSDAEYNLKVMDNIIEYIDFFKNADVLIFDTQYTLKESLNKIDWGHSSSSIAIDIASSAGVGKLVLFHHEPMYDDFTMNQVYEKAEKYRSVMASGSSMEIIPAFEDEEIII
ncbi:MAG: MBL fold metallo-hydrolase, partial [Actinomycetia bacterium]|nr:MBL fold metallo-hydrolase [Actinomycetes bacterium]